ncbi:hypothetical protein BDB01DRAFT_808139 [Pilobolus umbonatus]|nr:hypothetical protein BDB01DRAFT_808139 [Pilobolus umbonatus]
MDIISYFKSTLEMDIPITSKPLPALLAPSNTDSVPYLPYSSLSSISSYISPSLASTNKLYSRSFNSIQSALIPDVTSDTLDGDTKTKHTKYQVIIDRQASEVQELRQLLVDLNKKYVDQIEKTQLIEHSKFEVEAELEDLSLRLFEEANRMVSSERKERFQAESQLNVMENELASMRMELENEKAQLSELKRKFQKKNAITGHPFEVPLFSQPSSNDSVHGLEQSVHTVDPSVSIEPSQLSLFQFKHKSIAFGHSWLSLFQDFLISAPKTPLDSIHRLPFLKRCYDLDIEPCLKFGGVKTASRLSIKKVLETVIYQPCFIETVGNSMRKQLSSHQIKYDQTKMSSFVYSILKSNRFSLSDVHEDQQFCYTCGTHLSQPSCVWNTTENKEKSEESVYRFRLKEQNAEWHLIDKPCRDRLVAVCDFYVFIRHIRSGLQKERLVQSLFQECIRLRLCMFWARSGIHYY